MALQLEEGTQYPMRPVMATFNMASVFQVPNEAAWPTIDWTDASFDMTPVIDTEVMDDDSKLTVTGNVISLAPGIWEVGIEMLIESTGANDDMAIAVTSVGGTTVYFESDAIEIPASGQTFYCATAILELASRTSINFRATGNALANAFEIQASHIGYVKKIGNYGESGPA